MCIRDSLNIINEYSENYARLDSVIKEFPDSEAIIQRLTKMFVNVADVRADGKLCVGNGDAQLKLIENEIYNKMCIRDRPYAIQTQPLPSLPLGPTPPAPGLLASGRPVSYTPLDVYKRQPQ